MPINNTVLVSARVVAESLSVKKSTVLRMARDGEIPAHRVNSRVIRFHLGEVMNAVTHNSKDEHNA